MAELSTLNWNWTAIVNELGLGRTRVDSDLDILDADIFQSNSKGLFPKSQ